MIPGETCKWATRVCRNFQWKQQLQCIIRVYDDNNVNAFITMYNIIYHPESRTSLNSASARRLQRVENHWAIYWEIIKYKVINKTYEDVLSKTDDGRVVRRLYYYLSWGRYNGTAVPARHDRPGRDLLGIIRLRRGAVGEHNDIGGCGEVVFIFVNVTPTSDSRNDVIFYRHAFVLLLFSPRRAATEPMQWS